MIIFKINGVDLIPYLTRNFNYGWNALDGQNAGRTLDGYMNRDYITDKDKFELYFRPLYDDDFWRFNDMFKGKDNLSVEYQGSADSALKNITCYCTSYGGKCYSIATQRPIWTDVSFSIIEK